VPPLTQRKLQGTRLFQLNEDATTANRNPSRSATVDAMNPGDGLSVLVFIFEPQRPKRGNEL
jgi:hypothetical protein